MMARIALLLGLAAANTIILPPTTTKGKDVAVVWIHGADCDNAAYTNIAQAYIDQGASNGQRVWVGLPSFLFSVPEPLLIDHYVTETISEIKKAGFEGDNIFLAAHSLGGVMAQNYANDHSEIKGTILMGSVVLRSYHDLTESGQTQFSFPSPVLTLGGTKDGLLRVTRVAEGYYHQIENIVSSQKDMFPVVTIPGGSHMSFMSGTPPSAVYKSDLKPEIAEADAHKFIAKQMSTFIGHILGSRSTVSDKATKNFLAPLIEGMKMEGSYAIAPPCYDQTLVNRDSDPTCGHGAPWNAAYTQLNMAGDLPKKVKLNNNDNFHRVYTTTPVHLPQVNNTCDGTSKCTLESITVTENYYERLDSLDTGKYPISAFEMKTKLSSRQRMQADSGVDVDFSDSDETGNRCGDINNESLQWGIAHSSAEAVDRYNKLGQKYVIGDDMGPYNEGPLWIWTYMDYKTSKDKTTVTVSAPMMRTPTSYFIGSAAGFHYCKVLSPFRVMEWIYVDSLYEFDGLKSSSTTELVQE
uniref:Alpha/beta hydrolase fold-5 domain-containing protein n=1 Tax=Strombidinopsis acuminata TaxID=141414 RepID=A0A7S3W8N1_9SPIT|mmetsp:Transcript_17501/g.24080  ORF Transcript_17501/g.24080 Transcript_17501/m.24080 type:complete len:523 (+) Transcript_17501:98-1666(+)